MPHVVSRRRFLQTSVLSASALAMGPSWWRQALAQSPARAGRGPYGPPLSPDRFGVAVPEGFTSRLVAASGVPVPGTGFIWPPFPDGAATYPQPDGGWILAVNSEVPVIGGASSITFDRSGRVMGARSILSGTSTNCGGGQTPWGTWLSCEEVDGGLVWECDPTGEVRAVARPAMGAFTHEAAVVDPVGKRLYLTEDEGDSGFYRFTPASYPDLSAGTLEVAGPMEDGRVRWLAVPDPLAQRGTPVRRQVEGAQRFKRGEGMWFDSGVVYFSSTSDDRVWAYECATERLECVYDAKVVGDDAPLRDPDALTVHAPSGDLLVCEDADDLQMVLLTPDREVAPFVKLSGPLHTGADTELSGATFDPSGERLYFSSQRAGVGLGMTFEVTGPFRKVAQRKTLLPTGSATPMAVRARPAMRLATFRDQGLPVSFDAAAPGRHVVRLQATAGGKRLTLARRVVDVTAAGRRRVTLKVARSARDDLRRLRGRRIAADVVVTGPGSRRATRPVELRRGGGEQRGTPARRAAG
ncbi:alkaline phosphatase PhoX [Conexibacter sp. SYSU D00693]|uniref:alkaline phosphatase PhoX n=1 Tax=Conexibacter sp. SYSU D00693 TaxID=2812560 RepID=UPI00196B9454|nr:alkaline phosphatase PhoX [Conexibacter sp. SYSU D00693]